MKTHVSLTGLTAAVMLFVIGVAMHEAARADRLSVPGRQARQVIFRFPSSLASSESPCRVTRGAAHCPTPCDGRCLTMTFETQSVLLAFALGWRSGEGAGL
jgi:hypothetical protein